MPAGRHDLAAVRAEVRSILERTPTFRALAAGEQRALANAMVRVGAYLSDDPSWLAKEERPAVARALGDDAPKDGQAAGPPPPDPVMDLKKRLAEDPKLVGQEFKAGAVREGVEQFGELVKKVDFPAFVSGLVNGVFRAVVEASMEQMKAYGELLAACAKTVDDFARDNISDGNARDHIASRFPSAVRVDTSGDQARLRLAEGNDGAELARAYERSSVDLDDDDDEAALVAAAKLELARQRQQLMATMVLLGINRIVVTNGQINAKVVFDLRAEDKAKRQATAEMHDEQRSTKVAAQHGVSVAPWSVGGAFSAQHQSTVATVESALDETSEGKAEVKAQLTGDVQLKFKSETFPLERMVSAGGLAMLNVRAQPTNPPGVAAAPAAAPAPAQPAQPAPAAAPVAQPATAAPQPTNGVRR